MPSYADNNYVVAGLAVTDDVNETPEALRVDPSTNRLLIEIMAVSDVPTSNPFTKIDQNYEGCSMAITDNVAETIRPLGIDPRNGGVWVDILEE